MILGRPPLPRAVRAGHLRQGSAKLVGTLLRLPRDAPELEALAAAAVLIARQGRTEVGWATAEMEAYRDMVKRLESHWANFVRSTVCHGPPSKQCALHLAFREMESAVLRGQAIPGHEELLVLIARDALGGQPTCLQDVERCVAAALAETADAGMA